MLMLSGERNRPMQKASSNNWHPLHWHPLLVAVWDGDIHKVQVLLQDPKGLCQIDSGPRPNDNRSALYHAVRYNEPDIVRLLLRA